MSLDEQEQNSNENNSDVVAVEVVETEVEVVEKAPIEPEAAAEESAASDEAEQPKVADNDSLQAAVEAILMVAEVPLSLVHIAASLDTPVPEIKEAVMAVKADFDGANGTRPRGFELREVGGGWRIFVREDYEWAVREFISNENPTRLSQAALETLAVIAYRQPIARGQIASIRGVNVDTVVKTLLSRGLITEMFTDSETGAINYGTTETFLETLGINALDDLPLISPYLPGAEELNSESQVEG